MPPEGPPPSAPAAVVSSGGAAELAPSVVHAFPGGVLHLSHIRIADHVAYRQQSPQHLLQVTLGGSTSRSAGRVGGGHWVSTPDRRGSVSFTPAGRERRGVAGHGWIVGLQIGFDDAFAAEACEQPLGGGWRHAFNAEDAKALAAADVAAALVRRGDADRLAVDTLLVALARHVGRAYGKADRRRDDGWLHPAALARVIELVRADPAAPVPLAAMAREAGLGVSAFVRAFRGALGATPAAFARRVRLDRATELLVSTELTVRDIAAASGFASASHLVQAFRALRGVTPARWRREAGRRAPEGE